MKILKFAILIICLCISVLAQEFEKGEILKGTVKDRSGLGVSSVKIVAKNSDGLELTTVTSEDGQYEIMLPFGNYKIEFIPPKGFNNLLFTNYSIKAKSYSKRKFNIILDKNSEYIEVSEFYCEPKTNEKGSFNCDYASKFEKVARLSLSGVVTDLENLNLRDVSIKA